MKTKPNEKPLPIGRLIRRERRLRDWTQHELAATAGVSRAAVAAIEGGVEWPHAVERLTRALDIEVAA